MSGVIRIQHGVPASEEAEAERPMNTINANSSKETFRFQVGADALPTTEEKLQAELEVLAESPEVRRHFAGKLANVVDKS